MPGPAETGVVARADKAIRTAEEALDLFQTPTS
jgi:hypothetical protein